MTSKATARESSGDLNLATRSRALALPGRALDHISRPVLNRPYEEPSQHWDLAPDNTSTGVAVDGRRPSQSLSIVPKVRDPQLQMDMVPPEQNELINRIRVMVKRWRADNYPGATAATRQLLFHWRSETNEPRLFFAQVEAAETLIWLTEGDAGRNPRLAEFRRALAKANADYNDGIHRLAVRMATSSPTWSTTSPRRDPAGSASTRSESSSGCPTVRRRPSWPARWAARRRSRPTRAFAASGRSR